MPSSEPPRPACGERSSDRGSGRPGEGASTEAGQRRRPLIRFASATLQRHDFSPQAGRRGVLPALAASVSASIFLLATSLVAAEDKSRYTLFDPTPVALLREFNPDRPGQSHDPTTIDAGHVAVEAGAFEHVFDPRGPAVGSTRRYIYTNPEIRIGLTNWTELEVALPFGQLVRTGGPEPSHGSGLGDGFVAVKTNLLGNDGGDHLLALLPIVKLPTAPRDVGNGHVEALVSAPYNYKITKDLLLTAEPSVGVLRNQANTRYRDAYGFILGFDQTLAKVLVASVEVSTLTSTARKEPTLWAVTPSLGYFVSKNLQLDVGANLGLNKATPRYNPYLGVSARF